MAPSQRKLHSLSPTLSASTSGMVNLNIFMELASSTRPSDDDIYSLQSTIASSIGVETNNIHNYLVAISPMSNLYLWSVTLVVVSATSEIGFETPAQFEAAVLATLQSSTFADALKSTSSVAIQKESVVVSLASYSPSPTLVAPFIPATQMASDVAIRKIESNIPVEVGVAISLSCVGFAIFFVALRFWRKRHYSKRNKGDLGSALSSFHDDSGMIELHECLSDTKKNQETVSALHRKNRDEGRSLI
jgi:hypothetical protein